jgi:hypothetical protein
MGGSPLGGAVGAQGGGGGGSEASAPELLIYATLYEHATTNGSFVEIGYIAINPTRYADATFTFEAILDADAGGCWARLGLFDESSSNLAEINGGADPPWPQVLGADGGNLTVLDSDGFLRPSLRVYQLQLRRLTGSTEEVRCHGAWIRVHWPA